MDAGEFQAGRANQFQTRVDHIGTGEHVVRRLQFIGSYFRKCADCSFNTGDTGCYKEMDRDCRSVPLHNSESDLSGGIFLGLVESVME